MTSHAVDSAPTSALAAYEPALDGVRGLCIAGVLGYHACAVTGYGGWVRGGFIGVSVFFTLSGFLITSMLLREHASSGRISLARFWARRIVRLWPASLTTVVAVIVLSATGVLAATAADSIAATWSVTNWHVIAAGQDALLRTIVGPLGPTWSLAVEEQFYIVLAVFVAVAAGIGTLRSALAVGAVAAIVVPAVAANVVSDWHPTLEFATPLRIPEMAVGVLLAVASSSPLMPRVARAVADIGAGVGVAIMVGLFMLVDYDPPWLLRGGYVAVAVVTAITVAGLLQRGVVAHLLSWAPLRGLGLISYSVYLVHWPVISILTKDRLGFDGAPRLAVCVTAALACGWLLHAGVESPLRRLNRGPATPRPAAVIVGGVAAALGVTALALVAQ